MRLILIHGAGASRLSWRGFYNRTKHQCSVFEYKATHKWETIIEGATKQIGSRPEKLIVVGHSFGGVVAWHVAQRCDNVIGGISVSTPWGGNTWADTISFLAGLSGQYFFKNIGRHQNHLWEPRSKPPAVPWLNLVTTKGIFTNPPNDGVVTVSSQEELRHGPLTQSQHMAYSHGEVLSSDDFLIEVSRFVNGIEGRT